MKIDSVDNQWILMLVDEYLTLIVSLNEKAKTFLKQCRILLSFL